MDRDRADPKGIVSVEKYSQLIMLSLVLVVLEVAKEAVKGRDLREGPARSLDIHTPLGTMEQKLNGGLSGEWRSPHHTHNRLMESVIP